MILDQPGRPSALTSVLQGGRQEAQRQRRRCEDRSRGRSTGIAGFEDGRAHKTGNTSPPPLFWTLSCLVCVWCSFFVVLRFYHHLLECTIGPIRIPTRGTKCCFKLASYIAWQKTNLLESTESTSVLFCFPSPHPSLFQTQDVEPNAVLINYKDGFILSFFCLWLLRLQ